MNRGLLVLNQRLRPPSLFVSLALLLTALSSCVQQQSAPSASAAPSGGSQLYTQGLDDIAELYLEPVSTRKVAVSGAMHLARLDNRIGVSDALGSGFGSALSLTYDGRDVAFFAIPADDQRRQWGDTLTSIAGMAKQLSPKLAAAPQTAIDKAVFDGMTAALDRFSRYSDPDVALDQRADRNGYGGVGITFENTNDLARITAVTPDGPADRAGIHPEDRVTAVDGVPTAGRTHEEIVHQLRGPLGTPVALRVEHPGAAPRDLHLQRAFVTSPSVTASREGNVGIIKITNFNRTTTERVADALKRLQASGGPLAGLVLDLRNNPGGLLDQSVSLADLFVSHGPIVSTVGRHPASYQSFTADGHPMAPSLPLVVVINGASASSAEIVASALQDAGRAVVLGSSSFGKGTVQTVMRMANDGELILTWARLITPAGYRLQRHGVVPTICTAALAANGDAAIRAVGIGALASRASLDDDAWVELRNMCPSQQTSPAIDMKLAEQLLADPKFYAEALHALPTAPLVAQNHAALPAGASPVTLTDVKRTLSFEAH